MPASVLVALITAAPSILNAVLAILEDIAKSGHPPQAPLTQAHVARIAAAVNVPLAVGWAEDYGYG